MKEPKRLLSGGSPLEQSILASANDDESPSSDLEKRVLAAMAAAPLAAAAASTPTFARWLSTRTVVTGVASIAVGALIIGAILRQGPAPATAPPRPAAPVATVAATAEPPPASTAAAKPETVMTPDSLPNAPARASATPSARAATAPTPSTAASASIAREIELLDSVKSKLGAGSASDAAHALDAYDAEFPQGTLRPEATVLRIRTLLLAGDRAGAEKLGSEFLAKNPNGVHAKRVRALLEEK